MRPECFPRESLGYGRLVKIEDRAHKVHREQLAQPHELPASVLDSLPQLQAGQDLRDLLGHIRRAWRDHRPVVLGIGGHVIKCGLAPLIAELVRRGRVQAVAMNGGAAIHDAELAGWGMTSEFVDETLPTGEFGAVYETGRLFATALAQTPGHTVGWALGNALHEGAAPWADDSVLVAGARTQTPVIVHLSLGGDTIHFHPLVDLRRLAAASVDDLEVFAAVIADVVEGGVYLNCGSAVVLPELFGKLVTRAISTGRTARNLVTANFDMQDGYRPRTNVVRRPTFDGHGYTFLGQHEVVLALFLQVLLGVD